MWTWKETSLHLSLSPCTFLVNGPVTGNEACIIWWTLPCKSTAVCCVFLKCLLPELHTSSSCSMATVLQIFFNNICNYLNINAWSLNPQNSKGASKSIHTSSCLLCSHSMLCDISMKQIPSTWADVSYLALKAMTVSIWSKQALSDFAAEFTTSSVVLWAPRVLKIRHPDFALIINCCFSWQAESLLIYWLQYNRIPEESSSDFSLSLNFKSPFCYLV